MNHGMFTINWCRISQPSTVWIAWKPNYWRLNYPWFKVIAPQISATCGLWLSQHFMVDSCKIRMKSWWNHGGTLYFSYSVYAKKHFPKISAESPFRSAKKKKTHRTLTGRVPRVAWLTGTTGTTWTDRAGPWEVDEGQGGENSTGRPGSFRSHWGGRRNLESWASENIAIGGYCRFNVAIYIIHYIYT